MYLGIYLYMYVTELVKKKEAVNLKKNKRSLGEGEMV